MSPEITSPNVVVVGSLHYDVMVKAPLRPRQGETVIGDAWWPKCGGKGGNQAVEAALAGARTAMVGAVGDDAFAAPLLENLAAAGVDIVAVARHPGRGSGMSVAIEDASGDYAAVVVSGVNRDITIDPAIAAGWSPATVLVLQNEIPAAANLAAARLARVAGARVIHNAAPALAPDPELSALVDIVVVNAIEAEMLGAGPVVDLSAALAAARLLAERFPIAIVTAGGDGVAYAGEGEIGAIEAEKVRLVSTHGAGDCFVGTLAAGISRNTPLDDAIRAANAAAARLVAMDGPARAARL